MGENRKRTENSFAAAKHIPQKRCANSWCSSGSSEANRNDNNYAYRIDHTHIPGTAGSGDGAYSIGTTLGGCIISRDQLELHKQPSMMLHRLLAYPAILNTTQSLKRGGGGAGAGIAASPGQGVLAAPRFPSAPPGPPPPPPPWAHPLPAVEQGPARNVWVGAAVMQTIDDCYTSRATSEVGTAKMRTAVTPRA